MGVKIMNKITVSFSEIRELKKLPNFYDNDKKWKTK